MSRQLQGVAGLLIGFALYALAMRLPVPWNSVLIGALFVVLGAGAWRYGHGERWIQVLGVVLLVYGLLRAFVLR